jgi:pyruvate dehydrogenase E1 component beta subunit
MSGGRFSVPIVFRGPNGAAAQVSSQHSHCVEALYGNLPGLKIVACSTPYDAKGLLKTAIRDDNPVLFLESELDYGLKGEIPDEEYLVPFGKAKVEVEGKELTLVSHGHMMQVCREAVKQMRSKGVSVELIDLRSLRPLDIQTVLASVQKTGHVLLVEEGHSFGGICSEVGMEIMEKGFDFLDAPVERVCQRETPMPYSKSLEAQTLPNVKRILLGAEKVLNRKI